MLRIATIGTSMITNEFIAAVKENPQTEVGAIYSRNADRGAAFATTNGLPNVPVYDDLDTLLADPTIDLVYVASPNNLHFDQTKAVLLAGKHVITEKPAFTNPDQFAVIARLLNARNHQYYFEAARHIHMPNFIKMQHALAGHTVTGALLSYAKYSSRYDQVLAGEEPNIFSPRFAGGALQDLGVYLVYAAIALFGKPLAAHYEPHMLTTGVDGGGVSTLTYPNFTVVLRPDKTVQSRVPSEIYLGKDTVWTDNIAELQQLRYYHGSGEQFDDLATTQPANGMSSELARFVDIIQQNDRSAFAELFQLSARVNEVLYALRQDAGLHFPVTVEAAADDE